MQTTELLQKISNQEEKIGLLETELNAKKKRYQEGKLKVAIGKHSRSAALDESDLLRDEYALETEKAVLGQLRGLYEEARNAEKEQHRQELINQYNKLVLKRAEKNDAIEAITIQLVERLKELDGIDLEQRRVARELGFIPLGPRFAAQENYFIKALRQTAVPVTGTLTSYHDKHINEMDRFARPFERRM